jgi:hypothetical protein
VPSLSLRKIVDVFSFHLEIFTGLSLRLRADISKVTAHERIQHLYHPYFRERLYLPIKIPEATTILDKMYLNLVALF